MKIIKISLLLGVSAGLLGSLVFPSNRVSANEGQTMTEMIQSNTKKREVDNFDYNMKLVDVETVILNYFQLNNIEVTPDNPEYSTYLSSIVDDANNPIHNESFFEYVKEYSNVYFNRVGSMQLADNSNLDVIRKSRLELLNKTFQNIKDENAVNIMEAEQSGLVPKPSARRNKTLNVENVTGYARKWAFDRNYSFPNYKEDCTNFASQIVYYGNVEPSTAVNASGNSWQFGGGAGKFKRRK
ncbi:amidase domain-containing protein [Carnobacterium gallinarum]|uniref:amidase domain-containing protein n=1 Tax=Carnobacterium gallinarum TaxID=2749 RepID=UPI00054F9927|nr:amidase domain-containing protein [Carnobacterium gallinarum]